MLATCSVGYSSLVGYEDDDRVLRGPPKRRLCCVGLWVGAVSCAWCRPGVCVYRACMCVGLRPGSKRFGGRAETTLRRGELDSFDRRSICPSICLEAKPRKPKGTQPSQDGCIQQASRKCCRACPTRSVLAKGAFLDWKAKQHDSGSSLSAAKAHRPGPAAHHARGDVAQRAVTSLSAKRFCFVAFVCFPMQGITC